MSVRNGGLGWPLVAVLLAVTIALRLWDPGVLQALRFAALGRMDAWLPPASVRPPWVMQAEIASVAVAAVVIGWLAPRLGPARTAVIGALAATAILVGIAFAALRFGLLIDPTWPLLSVAIFTAGTMLLAHVSTRRRRSRVSAAVGRSLPPDVADALAARPDLVSFTAARRELTAVSIRIRDLDAILAPMPPAEAGALLRKVHDAVTGIVLGRGGMLYRQDSDECLALFNAPLDDLLHADHAVQAAANIAVALDPLNAVRRATAEATGQKYVRVHLDVGIDTGPCIVGNLTSERRPAWSAAGPVIVTAASIGRLGREFGVSIVVSEHTVAAVTEPRMLELDLVRRGGGTKPLRVFTPLDAFVADTGERGRLAACHARMIATYRNREWIEAEAALVECRSFRIEALATLYSLYRTRILTAREIAPPLGWEGAKLGTLEEIDAVTEVTPGWTPPRHSGDERDERA